MGMHSEKARVRKIIKHLLSLHCQQEDYCSQEEAKALSLLIQSPQYQDSESILAYASLTQEFSLDQLIPQALETEKKFFLPKSFSHNYSMEFYQLKNHLPYDQQVVRGSYGIREPISGLSKYEDSAKTLILVPGLAFTRTGQRLGRGKGFYDRFLAQCNPEHCIFMGVCYQCQLVEQLPTEETDIPLDFLLTPMELVSCKK